MSEIKCPDCGHTFHVAPVAAFRDHIMKIGLEMEEGALLPMDELGNMLVAHTKLLAATGKSLGQPKTQALIRSIVTEGNRIEIEFLIAAIKTESKP